MELLLGHVAGYVGHRTVQIGVHHGIFVRLAAHPEGISPAKLAAESGFDPFFLQTWCRSAHAAGVVELSDGVCRIDPITVTLLTDRDSPAYLAGLFPLLDQPEMFDVFADRLASGERTWWDRFSPEFIRAVAETSRAAYLRLIPGGFSQVPGLDGVLAEGADVLELACGTGFGLVRLTGTYPSVRMLGVDGDAFSLELASSAVKEARVDDRVELLHSGLEELDLAERFDVAVVNLSMHECRDIDRVVDNVHRALRPGGYFVISDFPFPDSPEGLRSIPGRIMSGIQFVEAQIDDELLPTSAYVELLERHGFDAVDAFDITGLHAVTQGRAAAHRDRKEIPERERHGQRKEEVRT